MATHVLPILNHSALPDGNCYFEPANANGGIDRYDHLVLAFPDNATKDVVKGAFTVPKDYVGTPKLVVYWYTVPTTGNVLLDFDAKAIADGESYDPGTDDETATSGSVAAPGTARLLERTEITLSATYAADDVVQFAFGRDGVNESSGIAGTVYVTQLLFQYADA